MKTKTEIKNWLLDNAVDEHGDLMLDELDFSDFDGNVCIDNMKVKGTLFQHAHEVQGNLFQHGQKVKGNLHNKNNEYGGNLYEEPSRRILKEITTEQLAELGYKLKEKTK